MTRAWNGKERCWDWVRVGPRPSGSVRRSRWGFCSESSAFFLWRVHSWWWSAVTTPLFCYKFISFCQPHCLIVDMSLLVPEVLVIHKPSNFAVCLNELPIVHGKQDPDTNHPCISLVALICLARVAVHRPWLDVGQLTTLKLLGSPSTGAYMESTISSGLWRTFNLIATVRLGYHHSNRCSNQESLSVCRTQCAYGIAD